MLDLIRLVSLMADLTILLKRWWGRLLLVLVLVAIIGAAEGWWSWVAPVLLGFGTYCASWLPELEHEREDRH